MAALAVCVAVVSTAAGSVAETKKKKDEAVDEGSVTGESTFLDPPPFPGIDISDAFRFQLETLAAPDTSIGSGHVEVYRPELGLRATLPLSDRLVFRLATRLAEARYRFRGDVFGPVVALPSGLTFDGDRLIGDLDLHAARLSLEGAYLITRDTHWLAKGEEWSAIGVGFIGSRWEDGDFDSGLDTGGALGVGYEIPDRLRMALGISLRTRLDDAELDLDPFISLRWKPVDRITVRTRELGLQVEYDVNPILEVYATGFRSSDGYRMVDRPPFGELIFRDRHIRAGTGFDLALANWLHFALEVGAIFERRLRVSEDDRGTLLSQRADPSVYFEIRFNVQP